MREIKFRAWDKQIKEMLSVDKIEWDRKLVYIRSSTRDHMETPRRISEDICCLMQYTGLNDKNGKEIYEGDIVTYFDRCYFIKFHLANFMLSKKEYNYLELSHSTYSKEGKVTVIGNIYENPELLKE